MGTSDLERGWSPRTRVGSEPCRNRPGSGDADGVEATPAEDASNGGGFYLGLCPGRGPRRPRRRRRSLRPDHSAPEALDRRLEAGLLVPPESARRSDEVLETLRRIEADVADLKARLPEV
jgi:hypothetical protein